MTSKPSSPLRFAGDSELQALMRIRSGPLYRALKSARQRVEDGDVTARSTRKAQTERELAKNADYRLMGRDPYVAISLRRFRRIQGRRGVYATQPQAEFTLLMLFLVAGSRYLSGRELRTKEPPEPSTDQRRKLCAASVKLRGLMERFPFKYKWEYEFLRKQLSDMEGELKRRKIRKEVTSRERNCLDYLARLLFLEFNWDTATCAKFLGDFAGMTGIELAPRSLGRYAAEAAKTIRLYQDAVSAFKRGETPDFLAAENVLKVVT